MTYLYIVDRKKDMVLSGGSDIYSKEVETAILTNPKVADAAVIGIPDPTYGEAVVAFVEIKPGESITTESVIASCREQLAAYKKPKFVILRNELPRNSQGKVLKHVLRLEATNELLPGASVSH